MLTTATEQAFIIEAWVKTSVNAIPYLYRFNCIANNMADAETKLTAYAQEMIDSDFWHSCETYKAHRWENDVSNVIDTERYFFHKRNTVTLDGKRFIFENRAGSITVMVKMRSSTLYKGFKDDGDVRTAFKKLAKKYRVYYQDFFGTDKAVEPEIKPQPQKEPINFWVKLWELFNVARVDFYRFYWEQVRSLEFLSSSNMSSNRKQYKPIRKAYDTFHTLINDYFGLWQWSEYHGLKGAKRFYITPFNPSYELDPEHCFDKLLLKMFKLVGIYS